MTLRPLRLDEFEEVWRGWTNDSARVWRARGPSRRRVRSRVEHSGRFHRGLLTLGIEAEGRLVGDIQARGGPVHSTPPGVVELGIVLWDSSDRGKGYGTEAVGLLTSWLFEHAGMERVQGTTAVANAAMRRSLEKLGFRLEGVVAGFAPAEGGRTDEAMYAAVREEWRRP